MRSCVLFFACLATLAVGKSLHRTGRIVHGTSTSIEEVPYQVSLLKGDRLHCGGSIISAEYVLTAAHCLEVLDKQILNVRSGSSSAVSGGTLHKAVQVINHEHYNQSATAFNDIGLVRVEPPFNFDKTRQPVVLIESNKIVAPGKYGKVSGFGRTSSNGSLPEDLQLTEVEIVSKEKCEEAYSPKDLPFDAICAHSSEGKDSCEGDGGGPLIVDGNLAGIISTGIGCASPVYPAVYTDVSRHRDFIKQHAGV